MEVWAPARYTAALRAGGVDVRLTPLAGLGIGAQIGWLTRHARSCEDYHQRTGPRPGPAAAAGWLQADHGLVYTGSITAQHGQPVVDLTEGRWVDDGSLLGCTYLNVTPGQRGAAERRAPHLPDPPAPTPVDRSRAPDGAPPDHRRGPARGAHHPDRSPRPGIT